MFGFFGKRKRQPKNALEELIFAIYGNPPPAKRANLEEAIELAGDLLLKEIPDADIRAQAKALNDGEIPYSTHDLALSVAFNFLKKPENVPQLYEAQLFARMKMLEWLEADLVALMLVQSFENVLYDLYKKP